MAEFASQHYGDIANLRHEAFTLHTVNVRADINVYWSGVRDFSQPGLAGVDIALRAIRLDDFRFHHPYFV